MITPPNTHTALPGSANGPASASVNTTTASTTNASTTNKASVSDQLTPEQRLRQQSNAAILQASQQVSLKSGNQPLALLYSAAIDAINEKLAPELGENALQRGIEEGVDVSPQATADRIVSLTTAMFGRYQDSNSDLSFADQVNRFVDVISGGIEQGFNEAREILDGLGVLEGDIAGNIDTTFDLVTLGLQQFSERLLAIEGSNQDVVAGEPSASG
ncbi:MAG: DUF5610 domain-containing protein [Motiliproteus sp.]